MPRSGAVNVMSSYQSSWNKGAGDNSRKAEVPVEFREAYPSLAEVLGGVEVAQGEQGGVPPATINVWFEAGELHFCIMPRIGNRIAFGLISDPCKGFESLEAAICQGQFGWKNGKSKRSA